MVLAQFTRKLNNIQNRNLESIWPIFYKCCYKPNLFNLNLFYCVIVTTMLLMVLTQAWLLRSDLPDDRNREVPLCKNGPWPKKTRKLPFWNDLNGSNITIQISKYRNINCENYSVRSVILYKNICWLNRFSFKSGNYIFISQKFDFTVKPNFWNTYFPPLSILVEKK